MISVPTRGSEEWLPFACTVHVLIDVNRALGMVPQDGILSSNSFAIHPYIPIPKLGDDREKPIMVRGGQVSEGSVWYPDSQ